MGLWALTALGIFFGYRPPKRHTRLDHLSFWEKLTHLDLIGFGLLTTGLTLFLTGLNLGGGLFSWTNARVLALLITGIVILVGFGVYEWKGTETGILHHELFRGGKTAGRTFAICISLIFIEGIHVVFLYHFLPCHVSCSIHLLLLYIRLNAEQDHSAFRTGSLLTGRFDRNHFGSAAC